MKETMLRELRRKRHDHLPEWPKVVAWGLDGTLIGNGKEDLSKKGLEDLWTNGFTNIVTTASPEDFAIEQIKARDWQHYIHSICGSRVSGEGKPYEDIAKEMKLIDDYYPHDVPSTLAIVGNSFGDIPIDVFTLFILSDNPMKVADLVKELDKSGDFISGYAFRSTPGFSKASYSRLNDKVVIPVLADKAMQFQTSDR